MNISVEEINIVNDGMYEIYTKFGMKIAIDVLKKRFSNITKEDTKTIKLLSCFVNYMKKKGATVTNIKDLNDDTFKEEFYENVSKYNLGFKIIYPYNL